ncbi:hypothetical protein AB1L42_18095 [Thalassoglobus sp. JC818]|uniref:hypothetical protein n=1 Tax=Thalassoglobus sp. JC818 TaxID=3232136 RepID=UPI00345B3AC4
MWFLQLRVPTEKSELVGATAGEIVGMKIGAASSCLRQRVWVICASLGFIGAIGSPNLYAQTSSPAALPAASAAQVDPLNEMVDRTIALTSRRYLDANAHTPWQVLHGLLALRGDFIVRDQGQQVSALDWIADRGKFRGVPWIEKTKDGGRIHPYNGTPYEFEGHVNQSLAIISMCNLPLDYKFKTASGQHITMQEMVDHAKKNVNSLEEITWTLWFLSRYVDQDEEWMNNDDEPWSMERLVRMQVAASPYNAACGGTHGMFALAFARNAYLKKHGQLRGAWLEADQKLQRYIVTAQRMQNRDGSFATNWFKSTGYSADVSERLTYSGHMLEWLMVALPKSRLNEQWIRVGVQTLCNDLVQSARVPIDGKKVGGLYHALHALVLYREQVNPAYTPGPAPELAASTNEPHGEDVSANHPMRVAEVPRESATTQPQIVGSRTPEPTPETTPAPTPNANGGFDVAMPIRISEMNGERTANRRRERRALR